MLANLNKGNGKKYSYWLIIILEIFKKHPLLNI